VTEPDTRALLRHTVATLAYRAAKVLRDFPEAHAARRATPATRTPRELLSHLADLMHWADRRARGELRWQPAPPSEDWAAAHARFFAGLRQLDDSLREAPLDARTLEQLFQGPIADALTHVGQLAMLRGMLGAPVRPESYLRAEIRSGEVGAEQARPHSEFDGDASHPQTV
jgi:hypothetical protein